MIKNKIKSLKHTFFVIKRGLVFFNKMDNKLLKLEIIQSTLKVLLPYIPIYMSAKIIDVLVEERSVEILILYVLITTASALIITTINNTILKKYEIRREMFMKSHEIFINDKSFKMDFANLETKKNMDLRENIYGNMVGSYDGIIHFTYSIGEWFGGLVSFIIATILAFFSMGNIFCYAQNSTSVYTFVIIAVMFLSIWATAKFSRTSEKKIFENSTGILPVLKYEHFYHDEYFFNGKAVQDVKMFQNGTFIQNKLDTQVRKKLVKMEKKSNDIDCKYKGLCNIISSLLGGVVYVFISIQAYSGLVSFGDVILSCGVVNQLVKAFETLTWTTISIINNALYLELFFNYMDLPEISGKGGKRIKEEEMTVAFHNVSYKYQGSDEYALRNITLEIQPKKQIAFVGMNGSGKTTMVKLLCGLYKPTEGYITVNGINLNELDYGEYLKKVSVVFQDFKLFSLPVGQNIGVDVNYDEKRVWECLDQVGLKERIKNTYQQLESVLYHDFDQRGIEISGGEEQRLAIARTLYKKAPFIILDEPTAALDPVSEAEIYSRFNEISKDKTTILISHRLSSCCNCDLIVVFDRGQIVQLGKHKALLQEPSGKYYELWNAQAEYYA